jgi:hypothetical protein
LEFLSLKTDINAGYLQKLISDFLAFCQSLTKKAGSGSVANVTDPQKITISFSFENRTPIFE